MKPGLAPPLKKSSPDLCNQAFLHSAETRFPTKLFFTDGTVALAVAIDKSSISGSPADGGDVGRRPDIPQQERQPVFSADGEVECDKEPCGGSEHCHIEKWLLHARWGFHA